MNRPRFTALLEDQFTRIRELNSTKGVEYSGHDDVLSDFGEVAEQVGVTPEQALLTYMTKHWRAINSYVQRATGETLSEPIEGRIQDLILYGLLLIGMIRDRAEDSEGLWENTLGGETGLFRGRGISDVSIRDGEFQPMRIYIAGPMTPTRFDQTQDADHTYQHFLDAAEVLRDAGHIIYCPATNEVPIDIRPDGAVIYGEDPQYTPRSSEEWASFNSAEYTQAYREVMSRDVRWICECDGIALLPGWRRSQGAMFEHSLGCILGLEISNVAEFVQRGRA